MPEKFKKDADKAADDFASGVKNVDFVPVMQEIEDERKKLTPQQYTQYLAGINKDLEKLGLPNYKVEDNSKEDKSLLTIKVDGIIEQFEFDSKNNKLKSRHFWMIMLLLQMAF